MENPKFHEMIHGIDVEVVQLYLNNYLLPFYYKNFCSNRQTKVLMMSCELLSVLTHDE